ncbi:hypothetical protein AB0I28_16340 [Phytomonospora sp. NPDC050363]|uniref:hypothetical protein n=1 Tax=Phytomonospora sp. NPDC050363 TaxID=3155642 RepID=UPI0033E7430B
MRSRVYRLLPAVLIAALALSACGGDGDDGKPSGAKEAWLEGNKADAELDQVIQRLTRQCMEAKGFSVHPDNGMGGEVWVFNPDEIIQNEQALTLEGAQKNGYGMDPRGSSPDDAPSDDSSGDAMPGEEEWDDSFYTELSDDEREAYYIALEGVDKEKIYQEFYENLEEKSDGDPVKSHEEPDFPNHEKITLPDGTTRQFPTQGCTAEVNAQIFPDGIAVYLEKEYYALDKFSSLIWEELREGADMQALDVSWSTCMSGRGYEGLESPDEAWEKANELYYGPMTVEEDGEGNSTAIAVGEDEFEMPTDEEMDVAREKEIKLAVAHVECDQESGHSTGATELMKGALDTYLVDYETELFGWYEYVKAALVTAQGQLKE